MKTILLTILLLVGHSTIAQTDVIALKNHSGNFSEIDLENSNFGLDDRMFIDSVVYLGRGCYVEVSNAWGNFITRDTICDNPYFRDRGYTHEIVAKTYRSNTVVIGFPKTKPRTYTPQKWQKSNSISWFVALLSFISFFYILFPIRKKLKN